MIRLCQCGDLFEAQGILDHLLSNRIEAVILNAYSAGAMGEIPFTETGPEIWLTENKELDKARSLLQTYQEETRKLQALSNRAVRCPQCNADNPANFDRCWSCLTPLSHN